MTRNKRCNSESDSFVAVAEQACFQPVLEHRQRRVRRNIAGQDIPHLCSSNRKGTTSDSSVEADLSLRRCGMSATHVNDDAK